MEPADQPNEISLHALAVEAAYGAFAEENPAAARATLIDFLADTASLLHSIPCTGSQPPGADEINIMMADPERYTNTINYLHTYGDSYRELLQQVKEVLPNIIPLNAEQEVSAASSISLLEASIEAIQKHHEKTREFEIDNAPVITISDILKTYLAPAMEQEKLKPIATAILDYAETCGMEMLATRDKITFTGIGLTNPNYMNKGFAEARQLDKLREPLRKIDGYTSREFEHLAKDVDLSTQQKLQASAAIWKIAHLSHSRSSGQQR